MVENVANDGVEPKLAKIEASGVGKPTVNVKLKVKFPFQAHIPHIEEKPKLLSTSHIEEKPKPKPVLTGVRRIEVDIRSFFTTNKRWREQEDLLGLVRRQAERARFAISIDKSSLKKPYLTMQCESSGEYNSPETRKKPNHEGTGSRKCECPFRLKCFFGGLQCFVEFTTMNWRQS